MGLGIGIGGITIGGTGGGFAPPNLLRHSQTFTNVAWSKLNLTVAGSAAVAPDGTTTASSFLETVTTGVHRVSQSVTVNASDPFAASVHVKANGRTRVGMAFVRGSGSFDGFDVSFNLADQSSSGVANATGTFVSASVVSLDDDWFRLVALGTIGAFTNGLFIVGVLNDAGTASYAGDITKGIFAWGAMLNVGAAAGPYRKTD